MNSAEYLQTQQTISLMAGLVADLPLADFIRAAERADTVGWIIDPTLTRAASPKLNQIIRLARALERFQERAIAMGAGREASA